MTDTEPPLIVYRHSVDYPNRQAHAVQMTHATRGLADAGARVWMSVGKWTADGSQDVAEYFGLKPHSGVRLLRWPRKPRGLRDWKGGLFRTFIKHKLRRYHAERPVFYLRDKDVNFETILELARVREACNARIVLESHYCQADHLRDRVEAASTESEREEIRRGKWGRAAELELEALRTVDLFVAVSENLRSRLCEMAGREGPSAVIRNGAAEFPLPDTPLSKRKGIVYVGHAYEDKGVDDLLDAVARLPDIPLKIVGCRDDEQKTRVMRWADEKGVADRVTITGFVASSEVAEHMAEARVAVVPLKYGDGSPIKAFEYMAAGLPIVATDAQANVEIIEESGAGVLTTAQDPVAMADAIGCMLEDDALAEAHRQNGLAWIARNTWQKRGEKLLSLFAGLPTPRDR